MPQKNEPASNATSVTRLKRDLQAEREGLAGREAQWRDERTALDSRLEALQRSLDDARATHETERDESTARASEHETRRVEIATALARAEERGVSLEKALEERSSERDDIRGEVNALRDRLQAVTEKRDELEAEQAASARDAQMAVLLEQLVADDRTGRVLTLLESIDARCERSRRRWPRPATGREG